MLLKDALQELVVDQQDNLRAQIAEAPVLSEKIQALVDSIGGDVLVADRSEFPVSMFNLIARSTDADCDWKVRTLRLEQYEKGRLTKQEFAHGAINEAEAFGQSLINASAGFVWQEIMLSASIAEEQAMSLNTLSAVLARHLAEFDEPMLLLPFAYPEWMEDWLYSWSHKVQMIDFELQRSKSKTDHGSVGRLVHQRTGKKILLRSSNLISQPMLFDTSALQVLRFRELENEALFDIEFIEDGDDPTIGRLLFQWQFTADLGDIEFTRITWQ